jgi:hypothetical protein
MPLDQEAHEGHQGYTIYEDNANLDNNVPPYGTVASQNDWNNGGYWISRLNRPPDIILVHLGTNDIGRGQDGNGMAAASNMDALLTHLYALAPNAYVIVAKIVAVNGSVNANVIEFNNQLPGVVANHAATGQHVTLVDQYANFVDDYGNVKGFLQFDGVHPNQAGYDLMADTWFHGIRALFPSIVASNPPPVVVGPVAVQNFSFETNALSDGGRSGAPGWIISAPTGGIYAPQADAFTNIGGQLPAPALGRQLAFIQNEPNQIGSMQQMFPDVYLANNTIYTLSVAVGRALSGYSFSSDNFSGYKIELMAGGSVIAAQQDSFVPLAGAFQDATLIFTATTNTVPTNLLGGALTIRLTSDHNPSGSTASTFFDDVRLAAVPIPPLLTITRNTNQVVIGWPADYIGWRLQVLTNSLYAGPRENWVDVAGSTAVHNVSLTLAPADGAVLFRMIYP